MSGTTWVYVMLGFYIVYCFYWGLSGCFTEKTAAGSCRCRPVDSLHRLSDGGHRCIIFRLDLHRSSGVNLARWSGLPRFRVLLRVDHSDHRRIFCQA